jgi:hypothetical protein
MPQEPSVHDGSLVRREVVQDDVDLQILLDALVELGEKNDEVLCAVLLLARELVDELRVVGNLERARDVRLEPEGAPDAADGGVAQAGAIRSISSIRRAGVHSRSESTARRPSPGSTRRTREAWVVAAFRFSSKARGKTSKRLEGR